MSKVTMGSGQSDEMMIDEQMIAQMEAELSDPELDAELRRISAEGAKDQIEPCPPPYDELSKFHPVKANAKNKILKLQDLISPVIGIFEGKEFGKFSPIYLIRTKNGLVKIFGSSDLDSKMQEISIGSEVSIARGDEIITSSGRLFYKADVRISKK